MAERLEKVRPFQDFGCEEDEGFVHLSERNDVGGSGAIRYVWRRKDLV